MTFVSRVTTVVARAHASIVHRNCSASAPTCLEPRASHNLHTSGPAPPRHWRHSASSRSFARPLGCPEPEIVLTLVTRNNEGHLAYRSPSEPPRGRGTTLGGQTDDPRAEGTRTAAACHPAGGTTGQCQSGLPRGRNLAGLVLSLALAAGALRAGRCASPPAPGPRRPAGAAGAGDRTPAAERGGERGDVGRQSDRGVPATPLAAARGPQHGAAGVAPRGPGDSPAAAARTRTPSLDTLGRRRSEWAAL